MAKIVYAISSGEVGGAQTWVRQQFDLFSSTHNVKIVTSNHEWLSEQVGRESVVAIKGLNRLCSIFAIISLFRFLNVYRPEVLVCSSASAGIYSRICCFFLRIPCIYVSHGWSCLYVSSRFSKLFIWVEWILSKITGRILCVSHADAVSAVEKINISAAKIITKRNTVPARKMKIAKNNEGGPIDLLFVARLTKPKRVDLLIDALANDFRFKVTVIGDGPLRPQCNSFANFHFLGQRPSFDDFAAYDAFILLSDSEGLPMSALEAGSAGLPLILSKVGGCPECIQWENGFLAENNVTSIKWCLNELANNFERVLTCSQKSAVYFSNEDELSAYSAIYGLCV